MPAGVTIPQRWPAALRLHGHELRPSSNQPTWPGPDGLWRAQATCPRLSRGVCWRRQHPAMPGAVATRPAPLAWALRSMKSKASWRETRRGLALGLCRCRTTTATKSEGRGGPRPARLGFELAPRDSDSNLRVRFKGRKWMPRGFSTAPSACSLKRHMQALPQGPAARPRRAHEGGWTSTCASMLPMVPLGREIL